MRRWVVTDASFPAPVVEWIQPSPDEAQDGSSNLPRGIFVFQYTMNLAFCLVGK
jgi:hypothetical protein